MKSTYLGRSISLLRKDRGISIRDMAKEIGISVTAFARMERGGDCGMENLVLIINWLIRQRGQA